MRIDNAQQMHTALIDPAIQIVLSALQRFFNQEAARAARGRQPGGDDAVKGREQAPHRPALGCAKARQPQIVVRLIEPAREDGKRAAHRFYMRGKLQVVRHALRQRIQHAKSDIRFGTHALKHLARIQLVMAGEDRFRRRAGQAAALGHQRGTERALKFLMRQHGGPAAPARLCSNAIGKALEIKAQQLQLARQPADVVAALVDLQVRPQSRMRERVIVLIKQQADARCAGSGWESHVRTGRTQALKSAW